MLGYKTENGMAVTSTVPPSERSAVDRRRAIRYTPPLSAYLLYQNGGLYYVKYKPPLDHYVYLDIRTPLPNDGFFYLPP
mgnify:CR=1 FL=1